MVITKRKMRVRVLSRVRYIVLRSIKKLIYIRVGSAYFIISYLFGLLIKMIKSFHRSFN